MHLPHDNTEEDSDEELDLKPIFKISSAEGSPEETQNNYTIFKF